MGLAALLEARCRPGSSFEQRVSCARAALGARRASMLIRDDPRVNAASWPVAVALAHEHTAAYARERGAIKALQLRLATGKCKLQCILEENDYCSTRSSAP